MSPTPSPESTDSQLFGTYGYSNTLERVYYGPGSVKTALPKLLLDLGVTKPLIVTGKSLRTKTNVITNIEQVVSSTSNSSVAGVFSEIGEHSPISGIRKGVEVLTNGQADGIVAVGGGSPIDASKAIIHYHRETTGGEKYLKLIAVPTTLSAAEYTIGAGYTDDSGQKVAVSSPQLAPSGIILDAELTLNTPERLWLSTGIRALDHAVENLYRPFVPHPIKVLCYSALADLFKYLPESKADPKNIEARQRLQVASWMSLWPLKMEQYSALGISHALGHKLGATYGIPHGITSCLTLSPVVALQAEIAIPEHKQYLANALFYLNVPTSGSVDGDIKRLSTEIANLVESLGLKSYLETFNVPREDLPRIAGLALGNDSHEAYGRVVKFLEDLYSP